jgi:hypothetical protein
MWRQGGGTAQCGGRHGAGSLVRGGGEHGAGSRGGGENGVACSAQSHPAETPEGKAVN